jgi:hypothetical protein
MTTQKDSHWFSVGVILAGFLLVVIVLSVLEKPAPQTAPSPPKSDDVSSFNSYWPTTIRVDTDMDSFWLLNEERVCQTHPGDKGRVSVVSCNAIGSHRDHNIPVRFWGSVDRNIVSSWKSRGESDEFNCKQSTDPRYRFPVSVWV